MLKKRKREPTWRWILLVFGEEKKIKETEEGGVRRHGGEKPRRRRLHGRGVGGSLRGLQGRPLGHSPARFCSLKPQPPAGSAAAAVVNMFYEPYCWLQPHLPQNKDQCPKAVTAR